MERTLEGVTVTSAYFIDFIKSFQPTLVVLDNCFWESKPALLQELLKLRKEFSFQLILVDQFQSAKHNIGGFYLPEADTIFAPSFVSEFDKTYIEWCAFIKNLSLYDEEDLVKKP
jgi:hypothetical protein